MDRNDGALAVLYAGICGSEALQLRLPSSEAEHAVHRCQKRITQTIDGYGGQLIHEANAVMATFDDNQAALQAGADICRRVAALPPTSGVNLAVRVGVCVGHKPGEVAFFQCSDSNPSADLARLAQPGQLLLSVPMRVKGVEWDDIVAHRRPELSIVCGKRKLRIFEVNWRDSNAAALRPIEPPTGERQLFLQFAERTLLLDRRTPTLSIGRLESCGLRLDDEGCSRTHAVIELRGDDFILIDKSTNGTYVTRDGDIERRLHRKEMRLSGRGHISFGRRTAVADAACLRYRLD